MLGKICGQFWNTFLEMSNNRYLKIAIRYGQISRKPTEAVGNGNISKKKNLGLHSKYLVSLGICAQRKTLS